MQVGKRNRKVTRLEAATLKLWESAVRGNARAMQSVLMMAKMAGMFDEPATPVEDQTISGVPSMTDAEIKSLSDEELEKLIEFEMKRKDIWEIVARLRGHGSISSPPRLQS
jgi:hypothetical protein